jgi:hypothetical protein
MDPWRAKSERSRSLSKSWRLLSVSTQLRRGKQALFPFLSFLNSPLSPSLHFLSITPPNLPECLSPAPSVPLLPGPLPRSLLPLPAALRLLSASRGEPGASRRALLVSYPALQAGHGGRNVLSIDKMAPLWHCVDRIELYEVIDS